MKETTDKTAISGKIIWQEAMKFGAILGGLTILAELLISVIQSLLAGPASMGLFIAIPVLILNILKAVFCIWLIVIFARKLIAGYDCVLRNHVFRFGTFLTMFSSLIVAAWHLVSLKLIPPGEIEEAMESAMANIPQANAAYSESMMNSILSSLPYLTFFIKFIICFGIGVLASLVISRSIAGASDSPFDRK